MMLKALTRFIPILVLALSFGCFSLPKKAFPDKTYYIVKVQRDLNQLPTKKGIILALSNLTIASPYNRKEFVYQEKAMEFVSDFYNEFLTLPDTMLTEQLRSWLFNSGLFPNIVLPSSYVPATHILEGRITKLYGDYRDSRESNACLEIQFTLIDDTSATAKVIFQQQYQKKIAVMTKRPEELVDGWKKGVKEIFSELEAELLTSLQ